MRRALTVGTAMVMAGACLGLEVTDQLGMLPEKGVLVADVQQMSFRLQGGKGLVGNVGGRKTQFLQFLNMSEGFQSGPVQSGEEAKLARRIFQSTIDKHDITPWTTEILDIEQGLSASFRATGKLHSRFAVTGEVKAVNERHARMTVTWERGPSEGARMSLMVYLFRWLRDRPLHIVRPDGMVVNQVEGEPLRAWATGVHGVFPAGTRIVFPVGVGETARFTTREEAKLASFSMGVFFGGFSITPTDADARRCMIAIERISTARAVEGGDVRALVDTSTGMAEIRRGAHKLIEQLSLSEGGRSQRDAMSGGDAAWQARGDETGWELTGRLTSPWRQEVRPGKSSLGGGALWLGYARKGAHSRTSLRLVLPPVHVGQPLALRKAGPVTSNGVQVQTGCEAEFDLPADDSLLMPLARAGAFVLDPDTDCTVLLARVREDRAALTLRFPSTTEHFGLTVDCGGQPRDMPVTSYTERDYVGMRRAQPPVKDGLCVLKNRPRAGDLQIVTPYWAVTHNARSGGAISQIDYTWGRPGGVLTGPMATRIADLSDVNDASATLEVAEEAEGRIVLRASGHLCDAEGRLSPIAFQTTHEYHPFYMIRTVKLDPAEPVSDIARLTVTEAPCVPSLNEFAGGRTFLTWGRAVFPGPTVYERRGLPEYVALFERDVQCLEMFPRADLAQWTGQLSDARDDCRWAVEEGTAGGGVIRLSAHDDPAQPCTLDGPVQFAHFVGLPRIPLANRQKHAWHMLRPDVDEAEVRRLAFLGCDSVHGLVGDPLIINTDAVWQQVAERGPGLVLTCRKYGLEVIPYLFFLPMRRQNSEYAEHWDEWRMSPSKRNTACTVAEGWREYYEDGLQRMLRAVPYDGVYYDFVSVYECENGAHSEGPHSTVEALMRTLESTREAVGDGGIIIGHRGHQANTVIDAYLDGVVVFEHYAHPHWLPLDELEPLNSFVGASRRDTCVKSLVCSLGGLNPRYRRTEGPRMADIREIMCKLALQGLFPYAFSMWPKPQVEVFNRLYERFRSVDFDRLTFADHLHQPAVSAGAWGRAAVYFNEVEAYVVIGNPESGDAREMDVIIDPGKLGWEAPREVLVAEQPDGSGPRRLSGQDHVRLTCELAGYEYRVFLLRPSRDERPRVVSSTHKWWETTEAGAPVIITRGPLDQPCTLIVACTEKPRAIKLDHEAARKWQWDEEHRMATVQYTCRGTDEPHTFTFE